MPAAVPVGLTDGDGSQRIRDQQAAAAHRPRRRCLALLSAPHQGYGKGSALFAVLRLADLPRVDLGIAICRFELFAGELGLPGVWFVRDPGSSLTSPDPDYVRLGSRLRTCSRAAGALQARCGIVTS